MKKPSALEDLLRELRDDGTIRPNPNVCRTTAASIFLDAKSEDDDKAAIQLDSEECALVFASTDTVERLAEALNKQAPSIYLTDLTLSNKLVACLEANKFIVDET